MIVLVAGLCGVGSAACSCASYCAYVCVMCTRNTGRVCFMCVCVHVSVSSLCVGSRSKRQSSKERPRKRWPKEMKFSVQSPVVVLILS